MIDSCAMTRRSDVQRCPAVPAAANTTASAAISRLADGVTIMALLPPSSRMHRPKRLATIGATLRPIAVLPVALTTATPESSASLRPASAPPMNSW